MFLFGLMSILHAQEVQLSIDTEKVVVGIPSVLTVVATGFEESPTPEIGDFEVSGRNREAVTLDFLGVEPMISRQTSIVNGRRSDSTSVRYAYRYRLVVEQEGNFQVPSIQVSQGDVSATSAPGTFRVTEAPMSSDMAIALELPSDTLWVGQTIPLNLDLYIQRNLADLNIVVPLFDEFPVQAIDVDGVAQEHQIVTKDGVLTLPIVQETVEKDGEGYTRIRMMAETTLNQSGKIIVQPARVLANMVVGQQRGFMGFSQNRYQLFQAKDDVRVLDIRPLPLKDKPSSFSGAVGESFSIKARASKTVVAVGEPIPIELEIRGKGNLDGLQLPSFIDLGLDPDQIETPSQSPLGIINDEGAKVFTFSIRLKEPNVREIPVMDFAYFDPKKSTYQHAYTQPIALSVSGSNVVSSAQVVSTTSDNTSVSSSQLEKTLSTTQFDLSWQTEQTTTLSQNVWWKITGVVHLLAFGLWFGLRWRNQTQEARAARSAQRSSTRELRAVLERAQTESATGVASSLNQALKRYGIENGVDVSDVISTIEIESYHPEARDKPLSEGVLKVVRALLPVLMCVFTVLCSFDLKAQEIDWHTEYQMAQSEESSELRRQKMAKLQVQLLDALNRKSDDATLWNNLGTVSIQLADRGQAVLAYQQAFRLGSESLQIRQNYSTLQGSLPTWARSNLDASGTWYATIPRTVRWMLWNALIVLTVIGWRMRKPLGHFFAVLWLIIGMSHILEWVQGQQPVAVVMNETPLYSADHTQSPLVQNEWLPSGATVTIQQAQTGWIQVTLNHGVTGWLKSNDVTGLSR